MLVYQRVSWVMTVYNLSIDQTDGPIIWRPDLFGPPGLALLLVLHLPRQVSSGLGGPKLSTRSTFSDGGAPWYDQIFQVLIMGESTGVGENAMVLFSLLAILTWLDPWNTFLGHTLYLGWYAWMIRLIFHPALGTYVVSWIMTTFLKWWIREAKGVTMLCPELYSYTMQFHQYCTPKIRYLQSKQQIHTIDLYIIHPDPYILWFLTCSTHHIHPCIWGGT